jgi:hypothetical protein
MSFDGTTTFAEGTLEQVVIPGAERPVEERGVPSRRHFLDSYDEHLEALRRGRSTK